MAPRDPLAASVVAAGPDAYEALDVIGNGSFGIIRQVRRKIDGRLFARKELKFERMSERDKKQIVAEVNILRQLKHENIVQYEERSVDSENGILYIVMEYCSGGDLLKIINRNKRNNTRIAEEVIWSYVAQLVVALDACHYHGSYTVASVATDTTSDWSAIVVDHNHARAILHRDLKPENVFLDGRGRLKLGDFGLSKQTPASGFAQTYVGTPYYMSPEVIDGRCYDASSDIWALGCMIYELCTFSPPFDASNVVELNTKIRSGRVPSVTHHGYSEDLDDIVVALLTQDPKRRPTTRRLLSVANIRTACKVLYYDEQIELLEARWKEVEAREDELLARESALASAQQHQVASPALQAQLEEYQARLSLLEAREQRVEQAEEEVSRKVRSVDAQRQMCSDEWDKWYASEKGKTLEANQVLTSRVAELEAQVQQLAVLAGVSANIDGEQLATASTRRQARHSEIHAGRRATLPRADSLTGHLSSGGRCPAAPSAATRAARPTARRTASGGKARLSLDSDVSMASIREKVAAGTTGLGTPRSTHQQIVDGQAEGKTREERLEGWRSRAISQGSDEWIDQEAAQEGSQSPIKSAEDVLEARSSYRSSGHVRASRRQTIATELAEGGNGSEDESSYEPVRAAPSRSRHSRKDQLDAAEATIPSSPTSQAHSSSHAVREEQRMLEAIAARSTSSASTTGQRSAGLASPRKVAAATGSASLADDPQWMQYDEDDRPSPFIKRITRLPDKLLTRPITLPTSAPAASTGGIGNVGPAKLSLLMKATRAAAVQAAAAGAAASGDGEAAEARPQYGIPSLPSASSLIDEDASMTSLSRIEAPIAVRPAPPPPPSPARPPASATTAVAAARQARIAAAAGAADKENVRRTAAPSASARPQPTPSTVTTTAKSAVRRLSHVTSSPSIPSLAAAQSSAPYAASGAGSSTVKPLHSDLVNHPSSQSSTTSTAGGASLTRRHSRLSVVSGGTGALKGEAASSSATTATTGALRRPRSSLLAGITVQPLKPAGGHGASSASAQPGPINATTGATGVAASSARRVERAREREREKGQDRPLGGAERERARNRLAGVIS